MPDIPVWVPAGDDNREPVRRPAMQTVGGGGSVAASGPYGDIRDTLLRLPNHHGGNGYMVTDLFTVRWEIIRRLDPQPTSAFEFGALCGYFLVTALDAAPSIDRVGWVDTEVHTRDSNEMCVENIEAYLREHRRNAWAGYATDHVDASLLFSQMGPFDLVAVDSDHSYQGCLNDLRAASLLRPTTIMIDDWTAGFHEPEIKKAADEWRAEEVKAGRRWRCDEYPTVNGLAVFTRLA